MAQGVEGPSAMDGGVAPPPVSHVGSVSHGGAQGRYI
eukprot:COSAG02_NODE_42410_length_384_cov_49.357895_1_plen_36_part_10